MNPERSALKSLTMKKEKKKRRGTLNPCSFGGLHPCSSSSFGSFVFLATAQTFLSKRERSLVMLSETSEVSSEESESESESSDWPWTKNNFRIQYIGGTKVFKVGSNLLGGREESLVFKMKSFGIPSDSKIIGSCNGLVCLFDEYKKEVSLWNPTTEEYRILPKSKAFDEDWKKQLVAFGFDVETNDYKVVLLTGYKPMHYSPVAPIECLCRVQIYSLSTDSWRLLEGITWLPGYPFLYQYDVLYLNGSCFFMAHFFHTKQQPCFPENDRFVISFNFSTEIFTPIQLPDHHRDQELCLRSLGDKIAVFIISYHYPANFEDCNLWVLKEHGGSSSSNSSFKKEAWTKLHFFQMKLEQGESYLPLGLSDDGEFAMLQSWGSTAFVKKVKLYHLSSKEVKKNFLSCSFVQSKAVSFKPSLVSVIGGNDAATEQPIG